MLYKYISVFFYLSLLFPYISADAVGKHGLVVSSKEAASQIGIDILKKGGNAIDAAIGVSFALSVTHPSAGNLGGGGFMVIKFADGKSTTIDYREVAPIASSKDMFLDEFGEVIRGLSTLSALSSGVPGTVSGLGYVHNKYGSMKWSSLIYPSIILAEFGYHLDAHNVSLLNNEYLKSKLSYYSSSKNIFTKENSFELNDLFIQKDLSRTLSRISDYGYKEFYNGLTSDLIVECMNKNGGIISKEDLNNYRPIEADPISFSYRDFNIVSMPPSSSGGITLALILKQLEYFDVSSYSFHDSKHVHTFVESEKRAYAERHKYLGDTRFVDIPYELLLSDEYSHDLFKSINDSLSTPSNDIYTQKITFDTESEETTHFSIIDKYGNCVSVTTTLNGWFGNGIVVDGSGFLLNNEMDDFSSKPGHPNMYGLVGSEANSIEPGKRMLSSMTPTIVSHKDNSPYLILGSPGGSTIITTVAQIVSNVIDFNMEIKDAVEAKRFHHQWLPDLIQIENHSLSIETINKLESMKHEIKYRSSTGIGEANCIMIDNNYYYGAGDSRRGAKAIAY
jgi:gamma-glutamyltranspeptidase/glutathione hydrolase